MNTTGPTMDDAAFQRKLKIALAKKDQMALGDQIDRLEMQRNSLSAIICSLENNKRVIDEFIISEIESEQAVKEDEPKA